MSANNAVASVFDAVLRGDRSGAVDLLDAYASVHGYRAAMAEVMEPFLEEIGARWARESISLAQGYVAGKVAEDLLKGNYDDWLKKDIISLVDQLGLEEKE